MTGCEWTGKSVGAWDIRAVSASEEIPDGVRRAVLGGKRQILLVEGEGSSLDVALYSILFPAWEIVPRGGCAQVQSAVSGLRSAADFHWVNASGIVDRDGRENDEIASLANQGVLVLGVHEIESVYYLPQVFAAVAAQQAANLEQNSEVLTAKANDDALAALAESGTPERLAVRLAEQILARRALRAMPREQNLTTAGATINFALASPYADELSAFKLRWTVATAQLWCHGSQFARRPYRRGSPARCATSRSRITKPRSVDGSPSSQISPSRSGSSSATADLAVSARLTAPDRVPNPSPVPLYALPNRPPLAQVHQCRVRMFARQLYGNAAGRTDERLARKALLPTQTP